MTNKFAQAANAHMIKIGMTMAELCQAIETSTSGYYNYCNGKVPITHKAIRIARVLKTTVEELFG